MADSDVLELIETGAALGLLPVALAQSLRVRTRSGSAPPVGGARSGAVGELGAEPLDLLVLGDSGAVGAGAGHTSRSLAPRLAYALALRLRRRVHWRLIAGYGWTAARLDDELRRGGVPPHDLAFVSVGMIDALALTSRGAWLRDLEHLRDRLFDAGARMAAFSGLPPVRTLPGLSWPLGPLVARRVERLDRALVEFARGVALAPERSLLHLPVPPLADPAHLARDGLHPSAAGYAYWAGVIAASIVREHRALPLAVVDRFGLTPDRGLRVDV